VIDANTTPKVGGYRPAVSVDPRVDIGHVHLKVADIPRALDFYVGVLGFEEQARYGDQAVFISAGGYHHHIGLNTWESRGGTPPPPGTPACTTSRFATRTAPRSAPAARRFDLQSAGARDSRCSCCGLDPSTAPPVSTALSPLGPAQSSRSVGARLK
jgi:catechol 2,3-dioxygenase